MTPESVGVTQDLAGDGQAFGRHAFVQSWKSWATTGRQSARERRRAVQGAGRQEEADLTTRTSEALVDEEIAHARTASRSFP